LLRTCSVTVLAGRSAIPSPGAVDRRFSPSLPGAHVDGLERLLKRCRAHKERVVTRVERVCPAGGVLPSAASRVPKCRRRLRDRHRRFEPCRDGKWLSSRVLVVRAVSLASTTSERRSRSSAQTAVICRSDRSSAQPGLCHRDCSLRADLTALHTRGPQNRSTAVRGSTRHGPGWRALCNGPMVHAVSGSTNTSLRSLLSGLSARTTAPLG